MRVLRGLLLVLFIQSTAGTALLGAKQTQPQNTTRNSTTSIAREVRHELMMVPWYTVFDILQYNVTGNDVTLSGAVTNPTLKSDAENAVKRIEGVEKINNQIEVLPLSQNDQQIRRAEYRAIYGRGTLSRYGIGSMQAIHIIVKGGHVTLEGTVDNQGDKDAAGIYAKGVPNVFSVVNNLMVAGGK
jgi:hyperosmotically inducible protein